MIIDIGNIIISRIETLPFIDKYAGVIKVLSMKEGKKTVSFPASAMLTLEECESGRYQDLLPNSSKKSVLFLEDRGTRLIKVEGQRIHWKSSLNLVCWLNLPKLGFSGLSYSGAAVAGIISRLPLSPFSSGIYNMVNIQVVGQEPKSLNPYQRYQLDETVLQYLMYPYDCFVLAVEVDFMIMKSCLESLALSELEACNNI